MPPGGKGWWVRCLSSGVEGGWRAPRPGWGALLHCLLQSSAHPAAIYNCGPPNSTPNLSKQQKCESLMSIFKHPNFILYESFIGPNFVTNSLSLTCANFRTRSKKKEGGVEQLVNMGVKKGVFLSGCLNRLLTDGPIRGCCVVPAAAVSLVPQCPRQIFNPHTARYGSFAKIFFRIFCT